MPQNLEMRGAVVQRGRDVRAFLDAARTRTETALARRPIGDLATRPGVSCDESARILATTIQVTADEPLKARDAYAAACIANTPADCIKHAAAVIGGRAMLRTAPVDRHGRKLVERDLGPEMRGH